MLPALALAAALALPRGCQRAEISFNEGAGPNYPVTVCWALRPPGRGREWDFVTNGNAPLIGPGTIMAGYPVRKPS